MRSNFTIENQFQFGRMNQNVSPSRSISSCSAMQLLVLSIKDAPQVVLEIENELDRRAKYSNKLSNF